MEIEKLYEKINGIQNKINSIYEQFVKIHTDTKLRAFAHEYGPFEVYKPNQYCDDRLSYSESGFVFNTRTARGCYGETATYVNTSNPYQINNGKLVALNEYGNTQEMLSRFQNLTIDKFEAGLEGAIMKLQDKYLKR